MSEEKAQGAKDEKAAGGAESAPQKDSPPSEEKADKAQTEKSQADNAQAKEAAAAPGKAKAPAEPAKELTEDEKKALRAKQTERNRKRLRFTLNLITAFGFAFAILLIFLYSPSERFKLSLLQFVFCFLISIPLALIGVYVGKTVRNFFEPSPEETVDSFGLKLILKIVWPYLFYLIIVTVLTVLPYAIMGRQ